MVADKPRWGLLFFITALALIGGLYYLHLALPAGVQAIAYRKVVPAIGLLLSLAVLFFGHFSYPRLHSVRVYFLTYGLGVAGALYFALCKPLFALPWSPGSAPQGYGELLIVAALINLCGVAFFPASAKYRILRSITLSVVAVETIGCIVLRFGAGTSVWVAPFFPGRVSEPLYWVIPLLSCSAMGLSVWKIRREFFLGGLVGGCALLLLSGWGSGAFLAGRAEQFQMLAFAGVSLFLSAGVVVHGFLRMEHRIAYDPLLKIYNRDFCSRIITEQANLNVAPPFGVAMVDIDHFKQVNDTYGHQAGDAVLHNVAQAAQRGAGDDSIACRYGGEELALFFPLRSAKEVVGICERIRTDIEKIKTRSGRKTIQVTVSTGVSARESYSQSIVDVIQAADKALYAAKKGGRNQVRSQRTLNAGARK